MYDISKVFHMDMHEMLALAGQKEQQGERLYVLFDGACENNALRHLFSLDGVGQYQSLYLGSTYEPAMEYGPVLAALAAPSPFLSWFWEKGPKIHAGIALFSPLPLAALAGQLSEILTVILPKGPEALFRFYDPRLVRAAVAMAAQNNCTALTDGISALYSPRYTYGHAPVWEQIALTEQHHG